MPELKGLPFYLDRGQMVEVSEDVLGIVQQVREISPRIRIYYNEQTDGFDLTEVSVDGSRESLIFSVGELDARVISRLRLADQWRGREDPAHTLPEGEDFLSKIDADDEAEKQEAKEKDKERVYEVGERLAWAMGEDLRGVHAQILVPRSVNGANDHP